MFSSSNTKLASAVAVVSCLLAHTTALEFQQTTTTTSGAFCDTLCQQFTDGSTVTSIGGAIADAVAGSGGRLDLVQGGRITGTSGDFCGYDASTLWKLWAQSYDHAFPNQISQLLTAGHAGSNRICIDGLSLARLTAAASQCYNSLHGSAGSSSSGSSTGSYHWQSQSESGSQHTGAMGQGPVLGHQEPLGQTGAGSNAGQDSGRGSVGTGHIGNGVGGPIGGDITGGHVGGSNDNGGSSSGQGSASGSAGNNFASSGGSSSSSHSGGSVSSSISGWGHGNVHTESICFKIKSKKTDRYLTTYGSEYAFARLEGYYSVFRAYPSKNVAGGFTLTEINRNGAKVDYPVKLMTGTGVFKPLTGDKDAVWTFNPAQFGDSCWGAAGKKMSERQDWGGWGHNYRQASSGEDCVDIELEEADC